MNYRPLKNAINNYFAKHSGGDSRPVFFDIDQVYPELSIFKEHYQAVRDEFEAVFNAQKVLPKYHEIDPGEEEISNTTDHNWNVIMLYLLGKKPQENLSLCPKMYEMLSGIPNLIQAFFSIMDPEKSVPLHKGPYLGYLRYHLGVKVPTENPPQIVVNGQPYTWKNGEDVMFDDSYPHEVINTCKEPRVVLIIDVLRPLPFLPDLLNKIAVHGLAKHTYGRWVMNRVKKFKDGDGLLTLR